MIIGLGNPGSDYALTRHNMGFLVVQALAKKLGTTFKSEGRFSGYVANVQLQETKVVLLMPVTYMNLSGESVQKVMAFYKIVPEEILVVSDDAALPFSEVRLRSMGSSGGHNGLLSIEKQIGTRSYARLRVGIGDPGVKPLEAHVLERFSVTEQLELPKIFDKCLGAIDLWLSRGIDVAMNEVNVLKNNGWQNGPNKTESL